MLPTPSITLIDFYSFRTNLYSNLHFHNEGKHCLKYSRHFHFAKYNMTPNTKLEHFVFKFKLEFIVNFNLKFNIVSDDCIVHCCARAVCTEVAVVTACSNQWDYEGRDWSSGPLLTPTPRSLSVTYDCHTSLLLSLQHNGH